MLREPNEGKQQVRKEQGQRDEEEHLPRGIAQAERGEEHQDGPRDSRRARVEAESATLEHERGLYVDTIRPSSGPSSMGGPD